MASEVILLSSEESKSIDLNLQGLIKFLGIECKFIQVDGGGANIDQLSMHIRGEDSCVMVCSRTLVKMLSTHNYNSYLKEFMFKQASFIFVYGFYPDNLQNSVVRYLTDGLISSVCCFDQCGYGYEISSDLRHITKQFSGISFGPINSQIDYGFEVENGIDAFANIISINNSPFFTALNKNRCTMFLVACSQIVDIGETTGVEFSIKEYFSQLIPPMMFLKYVFKNRCWHNENNFASLIVDDSLLRKSYGFLNYQQLLKAMDQHNFASTIAFIPWNYRRTDKVTAKLFRERSDKLSICIHGCDHTWSEFGTTDVNQLNNSVRLAMERMTAHKQATEISFDNVMIFPQGLFSREAMKMLKCNNYLAAVNLETASIEQGKNSKLSLSDHLDVAIMDYCSFPLFHRRYPGEVIDFAFDLFLGKPLLVVEHHQYFKEGYEKVAKFVGLLNLLDKLRWTGLKEILKNTYLQKTLSDGRICCKIYTNNVLIKNTSDSIRKYVIIKNESNSIPIESVSVNGERVTYTLDGNLLTLYVEIGSKKNAEIKITYMNSEQYAVYKKRLRKKLWIYVRRYISEFRDNVLSRNEIILSLATKFMRFYAFLGKRGT